MLVGDVAFWQPGGGAARWCDRRDIHLSIDDLGFRQGVTAVERLRTYEGAAFAVNQHLQRFAATTSALSIKPLPHDGLSLQISELLKRNASVIGGRDMGITIFATPGLIGSGQPTWAMHLNELDVDRIQTRRRVGVPLRITAVQQPAAACWPRSLKVRNRLQYYLADMAAGDAAGLLVDADGSVTETSTANVAILRKGQIISPPPDQVLPGVTMSHAKRLAESVGMTWVHRRLFPGDLHAAREVWLMGTDAGLWFAHRVDDRVKPEPVTLRRLQDLWPPAVDYP